MASEKWWYRLTSQVSITHHIFPHLATLLLVLEQMVSKTQILSYFHHVFKSLEISIN